MNPSIVVALPPPPFDASRFGESSLPFARAIADRNNARILLISVIVFLPEFNAKTRGLLNPSPEVQARVVAEAEQYLLGVAASFPSREVEVSVRIGDPTTEILTSCEEQDAGMLVVTSHSRSGVSKFFLGSVALELVKNSECPVLVVRANVDRDVSEAAISIRRILVPLDQSSEAEQALTTNLRSLGTESLQLHLLHVIPSLVYSDVARDEEAEVERSKASEYLYQLAQQMTARGFSTTTEVAEGEPAIQITRVAGEQGVDLISMTTHSRSGVKRLLIGSVAESVLRRAPVPLLLCHPALNGSISEVEGQA